MQQTEDAMITRSKMLKKLEKYDQPLCFICTHEKIGCITRLNSMCMEQMLAKRCSSEKLSYCTGKLYILTQFVVPGQIGMV